ncbi:acyltransferase family protein [Clostridium chromiireducens]|uniref:acyltransferase family protein n=1 Tax=Clostridium chromiireducens TaxID=225345 RepID=UPI003AF4470B
MKRNDCIDVTKGFAVILVVLGHVIQYGANNYFDFSSHIIFKLIYSFHMPLFMFLSGYTSYYSFRNTKNTRLYFVKKRVISLLLPFLIWGIITSLFVCFKDIIIRHTLSTFIERIRDLFLYPANGLWFLWVLFFINVIHLIINSLEEKNGMISYVIVFIIVMIIPFGSYFGIDTIKWMLPFYFVGYFTNKYNDYISEKVKFIRIISICLLPVAIFLVIKNNYLCLINKELVVENKLFYSVNLGLRYIIAFVWIIVIFSITNLLKKNICYIKLANLGLYSLDIYVIQVFFVKMIGKISFWGDNIIIFNLLFVPLMTILITTICYIISNKLIRKNKFFTLLLLGNR